MKNHKKSSGYTKMAQEICEEPPVNRITPSKLSRLAKIITVGEIEAFEQSKLTSIQENLKLLQDSKCDHSTVIQLLDEKFKISGENNQALVIERVEDKDPKLEYAKMDYDLVHREIIDIKSCRTNIFMGTLGAVGAVGVGILGVIGLEQNDSIHAWLPWASAIPIGLLTASIIATVHKARGISERAGYMRALSEWLAKGKVPKCFCGWPTAKIVLEQCQLYLNMKSKMVENCPLKESVKQKEEEKKEPLCVTKARCDSLELNKETTLYPPLLHSFTSFSTYTYGTAYLIAIISLLLGLMAATKHYVNGFNWILYWSLILLAFLITSLLGYASVKNKVKADEEGRFKEEREKITNMEIVHKIYTVVTSVFFPIFLVALVGKSYFGLKGIWIPISVYGLGFVIASIGVAIFSNCYEKIYSLRKGRYSVEHRYHLWRTCFENCPLMKVKDEAA